MHGRRPSLRLLRWWHPSRWTPRPVLLLSASGTTRGPRPRHVPAPHGAAERMGGSSGDPGLRPRSRAGSGPSWVAGGTLWAPGPSSLVSAVPGSCGHPAARPPPSRLRRTALPAAFHLVPENNPKQTSRLSKHACLTACMLKREANTCRVEVKPASHSAQCGPPSSRVGAPAWAPGGHVFRGPGGPAHGVGVAEAPRGPVLGHEQASGRGPQVGGPQGGGGAVLPLGAHLGCLETCSVFTAGGGAPQASGGERLGVRGAGSLPHRAAPRLGRVGRVGPSGWVQPRQRSLGTGAAVPVGPRVSPGHARESLRRSATAQGRGRVGGGWGGPWQPGSTPGPEVCTVQPGVQVPRTEASRVSWGVFSRVHSGHTQAGCRAQPLRLHSCPKGRPETCRGMGGGRGRPSGALCAGTRLGDSRFSRGTAHSAGMCRPCLCGGNSLGAGSLPA